MKITQFETEYDDHGNPTHYLTKSNIHPDKNMEVWMEYDYSGKVVKLIVQKSSLRIDDVVISYCCFY